MNVSVMDLVFDASRLLEWLGWSITKRPHLLGMHSRHPSLFMFARVFVVSAIVAHSNC